MTSQGGKLKIEQYGLEPIPADLKRVKWYDYAMIQGAFTINFGNFLVPSLAVLKGGLPIPYAILATLIGATFAFLCISTLSIPGAKHGIPAQFAMRSILGSNGAQLISSPVRVLSLLYWFGVQVIGMTYVLLEIFSTYFNIYLPFYIIALLLGSVIVFIALVGFDAIRNTLAKCFPFIVIGQLIIIYLLFNDSVILQTNMTSLTNQTFTIQSFIFYASLAFVQYIAAIYSSSDITRYAKSSKHGFFGLLIGNIVGLTLVSIAATFSAGFYQSMNPFIASIQVTSSTIIITLIVLSALLSTITININNVYSGAFSLLNSIPRLGRVKATLVFGIIAMFLSLLPSLVQDADFYISLLGLLVTPMSAVVVFDYVFVKKREIIPHSNSAMNQKKFNKIGMILIGFGVFLYYVIPDDYSPGFLSFFITGLLYAFIHHLIKIKK